MYWEVLLDCDRPMTGFFRDGCRRNEHDRGFTRLFRVTADFLAFSRSRGNDRHPGSSVRLSGFETGGLLVPVRLAGLGLSNGYGAVSATGIDHEAAPALSPAFY